MLEASLAAAPVTAFLLRVAAFAIPSSTRKSTAWDSHFDFQHIEKPQVLVHEIHSSDPAG